MDNNTNRGHLPSLTSNGSQQHKPNTAAALVAALPKGPNGSLRLALTTREAAAALGISVRSLYRIAERHLLRPSRALRTKTWPVSELIRFLENTL